MDVLVLGGTRFMGKHLVRALLKDGHNVTIATRGRAPDPFGGSVERIRLDRTDPDDLKRGLAGRYYDVVCDSLAYSSNDVKKFLDLELCGRYVMISSAAVYEDRRMDTKEEAFDPLAQTPRWGGRADFSYDEGKRQAERVLFQKYPGISSVAVRFPYVIGADDYTGRLAFYVTHILGNTPMRIDNLDRQMAFVRSDEAGAFLAFLAGSRQTGAVNGSSPQTVPLREIMQYVEAKTGLAALLTPGGDPAPYNGQAGYHLNTGRAAAWGFTFTPLKEWLFPLLDELIASCRESRL